MWVTASTRATAPKNKRAFLEHAIARDDRTNQMLYSQRRARDDFATNISAQKSRLTSKAEPAALNYQLSTS